MNKIKSTLFVALFVAISTISALSQTGGQIPIGGRPISEPDKTTVTVINTAIENNAVEPKNELPSEISGYLWTLASVIRQFRF